MTVAVMASSPKHRKTGTTLGLLAIIGGLAVTANMGPTPAFANTNPTDCTTPIITETPTNNPTPQPTTQTPTPQPTQTPAPTPTPTPTQPPAPKSIAGHVWFKGTYLANTPSLPMYYFRLRPRPTPQFPMLTPYTDPNGTWSLPITAPTTTIPGADPEYGPGPRTEVRFYSPGRDGALGTADDVLQETMKTDATGAFGFTPTSAGKYRVVASAPKNPDFTSSWNWEFCSVTFKSSNPAVPDDQQGYKPVTPLIYDVTISETNPVENLVVKFDANIGLAMDCPDPIE